MHAARQSDSLIVPKKPVNKGSVPVPAESVEGRRLTEENAEQTLLDRTQSRKTDGTPFRPRSRGLLGVRQAAQKDKRLKFTSLLHHIRPELLRASFFDLKKRAAPGVDGQTWHDYAEGFEQRIEDLHGRIHRGAYRAQPSKRTYIPKPDGRLRPLGIAALEDKIVQQAVRTILECIYEQDFLGFSYGFRPERDQHRALDALYVGIETHKVNWIIDADIRGFFDNISHEWLMEFLKHRIADPRMLRLLKKWLRAGVSEDGEWSPTTVGTPQGAVISPLLANVFLHYVLDLWINQWRQRHARGEVIIVRYADDFVIGFREKSDALRCLAALKERFAKFGLELHPEKTRLIEFGRYAEERRTQRGDGPPETFDFLGFTHICGKTRKGNFTILRKSARKKFHAKLNEIKKNLKRKAHADLHEVGRWLKSVYTGWCQYYAVPGNYRRLQQFRDALQVSWLRVLRRRSQRGRHMTWEKFSKLSLKWLPVPTILHPYPNVRFASQHPR
ncbi:MAG: group II intron reverse transcriptase/maturase [Nitrospiraceae bacterium]|nr:MAG: group II intron reverse transcriptase/maturase [Nitrospiraceae bacterium]